MNLSAHTTHIIQLLEELPISLNNFAFYDVTSSYYEGQKCPLARMGNSKDKKKGLPVIVYGTLAEQEGRPVSVDVYPGGTRNIAAICWPKYPNERFIACFNPLLAEERSRKRKELLEATEAGLRKIKGEVNRRTKQRIR